MGEHPERYPRSGIILKVKHMARVTVRDVAARAGVSPATASRALAGNERVHPDLMERVQRASEELGFRANLLARALRTQHTDTVGMIVPAINNPYFIGLVEAVEAALAKEDKALILCDSQDSAAEESRRVDLLLARMVDGLIVVPAAGQESADVLRRASSIPVVQMDRVVTGTELDSVGMDNTEALRRVMMHLQEEGWRNVCFIGADPHTSSGKERLAAFTDQVSRCGFHEPSILLGEYSTPWGYRAAQMLLARNEPCPDAIVCGADVIAFGVMPALVAAGYRIGVEVAIVGVDDLPYDTLLTPRLSSVRHPMAEMAQEAVALLSQRASEPERSAVHKLLAPQLMIRESSKRRMS